MEQVIVVIVTANLNAYMCHYMVVAYFDTNPPTYAILVFTFFTSDFFSFDTPASIEIDFGGFYCYNTMSILRCFQNYPYLYTCIL